MLQHSKSEQVLKSEGRFLRKSVEKRWLSPEYNQRNLQDILAPRKRACLTSVPVADEAVGGGERTMGGDCSAEGGTREGRVRGTLGMRDACRRRAGTRGSRERSISRRERDSLKEFSTLKTYRNERMRKHTLATAYPRNNHANDKLESGTPL